MSSLLALLSRLETRLHHPGERCSPEDLERLLHPDFHEVARSGRRVERAEVIAFLSAHPPPRVKSDDFRLMPMGEGTQLLTYRSLQVQEDGSHFRHTLRCSIWRQEAEGWRLFYHQGTPTEAAW